MSPRAPSSRLDQWPTLPNWMKVLVPVAARADGARAVLRLATRSSGLGMACGMEHDVQCGSAVTAEATAEGDGARVVVVAELEPGASLRLSKYVAYHWAAQLSAGDLEARVERTLDRAGSQGYDAIEEQHRRHVSDFWRRSDIELGGAPDLQRRVRFNLFHLLQATARSEGLGVPAKGVTGRGYEGHYFWDSEIYVVPFLIHTDPRRAMQLLSFRCGCSARRANGRGRSATSGRCTRGGRSPARRPPLGTPPAPRSTTSTPTSPTPCATTRGSRATSASSSTRGPR
jgi:hypothetical protein